MEKKISVIIPVFNVENYIEQCLSSVVNQTYKNLEIILIDDGSTDNSGKICDEWAAKDSRIIVKHISNGGVSNARNVGLSLSTGYFVSMLDSDDYIVENMFSSMVDFFNTHDVDIVMGNFYVEYNDFCLKNKIKNFKEILNKDEFINYISNTNSYGGYLWNKLYKREKINNQFISFDSKIKIMEDLIFNYSLYPCINKVGCLDLYFNYYRQRNDSALNSKSLEKDKNTVLSLIKIIEFLDNHKFNISNFYKLCFLSESSLIKVYDNDFYNIYLFSYVKDYIKFKTYFSKGYLKLKIKSLILIFFPKLYLKIKGR